MSKQRTIGNTEFYKPNWSDSDDVAKWLEREIFTGEVLNFPSGESHVGDIRADIDPSVKPDVVASIDDPPFPDDAFDTVYCDPPYSYHAYDKNQFVLELWDCAKEKLVLQTGTQRYRLPNSTREVFLAERKGTMVYQVFQVFTRSDTRLSDW